MNINEMYDKDGKYSRLPDEQVFMQLIQDRRYQKAKDDAIKIAKELEIYMETNVNENRTTIV